MATFHVTLRDDAADRVNLRAWFAGYLTWMIALTIAALFGLRAVEVGGGPLAWSVWLFAVYAFYLSLCCTFFPAPTSWMVMLAASEFVASRIGLEYHSIWRLFLVTSIGALSTSLANLNEYHIFVYFFRRRQVARVRQTRLVTWAGEWFRTKPFRILALFNFIMIPVDVVRWLAITALYPRRWFFLAAFVGRWFRYAVLAVVSMYLDLKPWHIAAVQAVLVAFALIRSLPWIISRLRHRHETDAESSSTAGAAGETRPPGHPPADRSQTSAA